MQWRMLARRCPTGSMTLVGDFGQASRPGALAASWDDVLATCRHDVPPHRVDAHGQLPHAVRDHGRRQPAARRRRRRGSQPPASVRSTGDQPEVLSGRVAELVADAADARPPVARPGRARSR